MAAARASGIRSFSIGSVLGRSFSILGRNIIPFTILSVIAYAPLVVYVAVAWPDEPQTTPVAVPADGPDSEYTAYRFAEEPDRGDLVHALVMLAFMMVLPYVAAGALIYGVLRQLRGEPAGVGDCLRVGVVRLLPTIGVAILAGLLSALGTIALIIPGIYLACMYWVVVPVAVVERPGVIASLKRSAQLTNGAKWSIFVILLVLIVAQNATQAVINIALGESAVGTLVSLAPTILFGMLGAVACAVAYHDLRVAKEGVGIDELVSVFA